MENNNNKTPLSLATLPFPENVFINKSPFKLRDYTLVILISCALFMYQYNRVRRLRTKVPDLNAFQWRITRKQTGSLINSFSSPISIPQRPACVTLPAGLHSLPLQYILWLKTGLVSCHLWETAGKLQQQQHKQQQQQRQQQQQKYNKLLNCQIWNILTKHWHINILYEFSLSDSCYYSVSFTEKSRRYSFDQASQVKCKVLWAILWTSNRDRHVRIFPCIMF